MGIRIHVAVGYALTDLKTEDYAIADDRINPLGILGPLIEDSDSNLYYEEFEDIWTIEGYINFVKNRKLWFPHNQMMYDDKLQKWLHHDSICWNSEYGMENVLLITPPEESINWKRYDDIIDYHVESELYKCKNHFVPIKNGIWPWQGSYFNTETKERLKGYPSEIKEMGVPYAPIIPEGVQAFCEWTLMFTDPDTVFDLRPIIYYYWG